MEHLQSLACPHCRASFFYDGSAAGTEMLCPECGKRFVLPGEKAAEGSIQHESLGLQYDIADQHPVQAEGRIQGHPFYFRAKWDFWDFTACVSDDNPELPSWMNPPEDKPGFFQDLQQEAYYLSEYYGEGTDAGQMSLDVADVIIRDCAEKLLEALQQRGDSCD